MDNTLVIIPARYASTRFPAKMLASLCGYDSVIEYTWRAAVAATANPDAVVVATDDDAIASVVHSFGGQVVMTDPACRNGTERVAQALSNLKESPDIVVNWQGDAPMTPAWFAQSLVAAMRTANHQVATPVLKTSATAYATFVEDAGAGKPGATTAVFDRAMNALYFSKRVLPFVPLGTPAPRVYHHVGLYAYTSTALAKYMDTPPCDLELYEGLEQLRFLYAGVPIRCVEVDARGFEFWEVNNPEDIPRIETFVAAHGDPNSL